MIARYNIHPVKFALWLGLASILMLFVAFTSAYMVRQAAGNWLEFSIPSIFFYSTAVLIGSSIALQASYESFKKKNKSGYIGFLVLSVLMGIGFVVLQYEGWITLTSLGIEINGNPAGSFIYIISAVHVLHVLGGITALIIALIQALSLDFYVSDKRKLRFQLVLQYWHFVDVLWVYLLLFFILQR